MADNLSDTLNLMVRFIENFMKSFAHKLENNVGMPIFRIESENDGNMLTAVHISLAYAGPGKLTDKAKNALSKKLEKRLNEQFHLLPKITFLEVEGPQFSNHAIQDLVPLPAKIQTNHLKEVLLIASTRRDAETHSDINKMLGIMQTADGHIQQRTFINYFLTTFWPGYDKALRAYSQLKHLGPCSIATVVTYYLHTQTDASLIAPQAEALATFIVKDHPEWVVYSQDLTAFTNFLAIGDDADFVDTLTAQMSALAEMSNKALRELAVIQETINHVLLAGDLMRKVRQLTDFMKTHELVEELSTLLAPIWTVSLNSPVDKFSTFDYEEFCVKTMQIIKHRNAVRDFLKFAAAAPVMINSRISDIQSQLSLAHKERSNTKKAHKKAARAQARAAAALEAPVEASPPVQTSIILNTTPAPITRESKQHARLIAERLETKQKARQERRIGLFETETATTARPLVTTIKLIDVKEGITHTIDICPTVVGKVGAEYYQILPYKFILSNNSPCLRLSPAMQRLLHANQGRGFIGEVSPGQTGLKYFKEGKEEFVVLKAAEEERVLCAIKTLRSEIFDHDIELIIPVLSFKNHEDYERALQRQHRGAWLRHLVDDQLLLEESFELQEETVAAARPSR